MAGRSRRTSFSAYPLTVPSTHHHRATLDETIQGCFLATGRSTTRQPFAYIAERGGEDRAERFINDIIEFCEGLSTFPERGTKRDDLRKNLRTIGYERRATIAFAVQDDRVIIHGVFYGGQDYDAVLQEDEAEP
ncbi:type II toxin-antitoxin system RelE/ParE family toxin [Tolypothrix sp. VBCCA 56010]|uniref:type II toxin-antitoxin system RelE/ParE family toxin n=1 Tax=Tolypothrix sp. VBCCA 56010 TaxID=3137731 RepID=UPI003D7ED70A